MPDIRLGVLAEHLGAELRGDPSIVIHSVAEPQQAGAGQISLLTDPSRLEEGRSSQASAFVVTRSIEGLRAAQLICPDASRALGQLLDLLHPPGRRDLSGIDERAAVDDNAEVHQTAWVGPFCYIGPGARIGPRSRIEPFSYVGADARVGEDCCIGPGVTLKESCQVADRVVLGPGSVIGHCGFGYWRDDEGWHAIGSKGAVHIASDAEIGANSCVDRGTLECTRIGQGVKIDNLVQVGHNVQVRDRALLCAQVGLAGSVVVEEDALLGGQVGVADHRRIGRGGRVGAKSGVAQNVPEGAVVSGYPAFEHGRWLKSSVVFGRLGELARQVRKLRQQLASLMEG